MSNAIRKKYEKHGVDNYYKNHSEDYDNPHFKEIEKLLKKNEKELDYSSVLDFCCGNGEVSIVLNDLGYNNSIGCDPYTFENYKKNVKKKCFKFSFDDVLRGKLSGKYSSIICSFGMHLCEEDKLFMLTQELFNHADTIIIITPHKRPALEKIKGVKLILKDSVTTKRGKKVRLKAYTRE